MNLRHFVGAISRQVKEVFGSAHGDPELQKWISDNLSFIKSLRERPNERSFIESVQVHREIVLDALSKQGEIERKLRTFTEEFDRFASFETRRRRGLPVEWSDRYACLDDKSSSTSFDRHYTYHPAWAARALQKIRPSKHVDISSILNFSTLVSAFCPVEFYDFRPALIELPGLYCGTADLTALPFATDSIQSLSCMHVLEHIGLGRYGDSLNVDGDLKAISELLRVTAPGGNLLIVVPVGKARVQFNAHRIYDAAEFIEYFTGTVLVESALIEDSGSNGIILNPSNAQFRSQVYGCGCFWFRKS